MGVDIFIGDALVDVEIAPLMRNWLENALIDDKYAAVMYNRLKNGTDYHFE